MGGVLLGVRGRDRFNSPNVRRLFYALIHKIQSYPWVKDPAGLWRVWYPDFTLPGRGDLIVEYNGRHDDPFARRGLAYKLSVYADNGRSAIAVLPRELDGQAWPQHLLERIHEAPPSNARPPLERDRNVYTPPHYAGDDRIFNRA